MKIRFQADADLNKAIITGLIRRHSEIEFVSAIEGGVIDLQDEDVLKIAAQAGRILVSHDRRAMPNHFGLFIEKNDSPGVIIVLQTRRTAATINDLLMIWSDSEAEEWVNRIAILPLQTLHLA